MLWAWITPYVDGVDMYYYYEVGGKYGGGEREERRGRLPDRFQGISMHNILTDEKNEKN